MNDNEDSVFIPMSDLLTGFLFVFFIMILTFLPMIKDDTFIIVTTPVIGDEPTVLSPADVEVKEKEHLPDTEPGGDEKGVLTKKKTGKNQDRLVEILMGISLSLDKLRVTVKLDTDNGIVRLPAEMLFQKGQYTLSHEGKQTLSIIGAVLNQALKCNTASNHGCAHTDEGKIESVLVEGHTDNDPIDDGFKIRDNWDLAMFRATSTFREILNNHEALSCYKNSYGVPVMGVSGYGESRPIPGNRNLDENEKRLNRRIDLRFIMETETEDDVGQHERWPWDC